MRMFILLIIHLVTFPLIYCDSNHQLNKTKDYSVSEIINILFVEKSNERDGFVNNQQTKANSENYGTKSTFGEKDVSLTINFCSLLQKVFEKLDYLFEYLSSNDNLNLVRIYSNKSMCYNLKTKDEIQMEISLLRHTINQNIYILASESLGDESLRNENINSKQKDLSYLKSTHYITIYLLVPSSSYSNDIQKEIEMRPLLKKSKKTLVALVDTDFKQIKQLFSLEICSDKKIVYGNGFSEIANSKDAIMEFLNQEKKCRLMFSQRNISMSVSIETTKSFNYNFINELLMTFNLSFKRPTGNEQSDFTIVGRNEMKEFLNDQSSIALISQVYYLTFFSIFKNPGYTYTSFSSVFLPLDFFIWVYIVISLISLMIYFLLVSLSLNSHLKKHPVDYTGRKMLEVLTVIRFPLRKDCWAGKIGSLVGKTMLAIVAISYVKVLQKHFRNDFILYENNIGSISPRFPNDFCDLFKSSRNDGHVYSGEEQILWDRELKIDLLKKCPGKRNLEISNIDIEQKLSGNSRRSKCQSDIKILNGRSKNIHSVSCIVSNFELEDMRQQQFYRDAVYSPGFTMVSTDKIGTTELYIVNHPECIPCLYIVNAIERWNEGGILDFHHMKSSTSDDRKPQRTNGPIRPYNLNTFFWFYIIFCGGVGCSIGLWLAESMFGLIFRNKIQIALLHHKEMSVSRLIALVAIGVGGLCLSVVLECRDIFGGRLSHEKDYFNKAIRWTGTATFTHAMWDFVMFSVTKRSANKRKRVSTSSVMIFLKRVTIFIWYCIVLAWMGIGILPFQLYCYSLPPAGNFLLIRYLGVYAAIATLIFQFNFNIGCSKTTVWLKSAKCVRRVVRKNNPYYAKSHGRKKSSAVTTKSATSTASMAAW